MIAACFVVFIHVPFPDYLGQAVDCIARFAVPFFFAVSGYYSYGIGPGKIKKRVVRLLKLHLVTAILCLVTGSTILYFSGGTGVSVLAYLGDAALPSLYQLTQWMVLQINPYGGQLWYLSSLLLCYLLLWGYAAFWEGERQDNRPMYYASICLLAGCLTISNLLRVDDVVLPYRTYTNGWLTGIPMFALGIFLHEQEERLVAKFALTSRRLCLIMAGGFLLSLIQGFGGFETNLPMGIFLVVPALLLFLVRNPGLPVRSRPVQKFISRFGVVSTVVYILHYPIMELYNAFLQGRVYGLVTTKEDTLRPVIVLAMTLLVSFLWERVDWLMKRKHEKTPTA